MHSKLLHTLTYVSLGLDLQSRTPLPLRVPPQPRTNMNHLLHILAVYPQPIPANRLAAKHEVNKSPIALFVEVINLSRKCTNRYTCDSTGRTMPLRNNQRRQTMLKISLKPLR